MSNEPTTVVDVTPEMLERWLQEGDTVVVDVREDFEHAAERIAGAAHAPLSRFDPDVIRATYGPQRVVFHCRSGKRSADAASRFRNGTPAYHLAGGIEGWKSSGRATERSAAAPRIDVMRQVQIVAGSLVFAGTLLGAFVSPWFLALPGFVGAGLVFAGASGWCGMAMLLARMPWNRGLQAACTINGTPEGAGS